jgi:uncharacterized membrane protein YbhN (UPF0104 family)
LTEKVSGISKQTILRIIGSFVAVILLIRWLSRLGWREIIAAIGRVPFEFFLLAMGAMLISRLAVAARWFVLLRAADSTVSPVQILRLTFAGLFASNFLPTTVGGDVVRLWGVMQNKLDGAVATASLVIDRLIGVVGMATVLPIGIVHLWRVGSFEWTLSRLETTWLTGLVFAGLSLWPRKVWTGMTQIAQRFFHALSLWLGKPRSLVLGLLCTWVHMGCLFTALWALIQGLDEQMSLWLIGGLWSMVYFVTLLPFSINGLGIQEVAITVFFSNAGGISLQAGLTLAILIRTLYMLASLPGVAFMPLILAAARSRPKTVTIPERSSIGETRWS